jgi:predicted double-glycine peptidase
MVLLEKLALKQNVSSVFIALGLMLALFVPTFAAAFGSPLALPLYPNSDRIQLGWDGIKRQELDNTCGLAVLATILEWTGNPVTEATLHKQAKITEKGMSLFEWQQLAKKYKINWIWVRSEPSALESLPAPFVVQIKDPTGHFVIVRRAYNDHVYIADPNAGNVLLSNSEFLRVWTGRAFVPNQ